MRNAERVGDMARVVDVLTGAAASLPPVAVAVIIELQGHADDVVAALLHHRGDDGVSTPPDIATTTRFLALDVAMDWGWVVVIGD